MSGADSLHLGAEKRSALWARLALLIERHAADVGSKRVAPEFDPAPVRELLRSIDFDAPMDPSAALEFATAHLGALQTHTAHPRYFGLFNPAPTAMGIAADALTAAFNPQLSAWNHSPFAIELERHLLAHLARKLGMPEGGDGTFTSGGSESNHTALIAALVNAFPAFPERGLRALAAQPVLYLSAEGHRSVVKAARLCGLGTEAVREVPVDRRYRMDAAALAGQITRDRQAGFRPFLVVATAGSTSAGAIDPLREIAEVASACGLWLHVDAAWGGAAALVPWARECLNGIGRADSVTFDAHKWMSVPMGAGMFLTRHPEILGRSFAVDNGYIPRWTAGLGVADPYARSIQWSRRFIGLKVFLSLCVAGWDGYARAIGHQVAMGEELRVRLREAGWRIENETPLPVVCFGERAGGGDSPSRIEAIARAVVSGGRAWISSTVLGGRTAVLRACVTNYRTSSADLAALVSELAIARDSVREEKRAAV